MTIDEFTNIYYTGEKKHVKEALIEMNKKYSMSDLARMLCENIRTFTRVYRALGVKANKKTMRKAQERDFVK